MILSGSARLAGVMGWPVAHSLSPRLHGFWLDHHGIDGAYLPFPVAPGDLAECLRALPKLGFAGVNITVPHKEAALAAMDTLSEAARRIGAVNTVIVRDDASLYGDNTDAFGFAASLGEGAPAWTADQGPCVVIGAGGAARAVCVALLDAGVAEIRIVNRTAARAEALAAGLEGLCTVKRWPERDRALDGARLLVNATSMGMVGQPALDLDLAGLPIDAAVADLVYVPLETPLLAAAARRGHRVVDGLGMLIHQARPGFAAWFGVEPEVSAELRAFMVDRL